MSRRSPTAMLPIVALLMIALAACGGPGPDDNAATPTQDGVRPAPGGTVSGAEATAEPDALTPTPTQVVVAPTPTPTPKPPRQLATANAVVDDAEDGTYYVVVFVDVPDLGLSGVEVRAATLSGVVAIEEVSAGVVFGDDTLPAVQNIVEGGAGALVAFARRGASLPEDARGEVAIVRVRASDADDVRELVRITLDFTDAGLTLHGPIDVPLN